ncbi:hypothetical protein HYT01_00200 [Candidatus Giovannonibacteria bacterium]|nr:hypothetical protein [Candidatus Giovannonibacteria bacterium]
MKKERYILQFNIKEADMAALSGVLAKYSFFIAVFCLTAVSVFSFLYYYSSGLGLAYNDARSHLDIGRRVVEGLKPGLAQLGSVWLPLPHILMIPTVWNDFMWHSGLSGAIFSMPGFVLTGIFIWKFLEQLNAGFWGKIAGILVFVLNVNVLYLQSTAMTELLLLATMTAAAYYFMLWFKGGNILHLISSAFWLMLSTLIRYDGWFLFVFAVGMLLVHVWLHKGYGSANGVFVLFDTLAGFGIILWFLWNQLIFGNPLYFIYGPYSAYVQQLELESAGVLATKGNFLFSLKTFYYALAYDTGAFTLLLGVAGTFAAWFSRELPSKVRYALLILWAPLFFNVLALYLGHSVLYVQGLNGDSLFNVRYGLMLMPTVAIFTGYLLHKMATARGLLFGLFFFVTFFQFTSGDAITIDDALVGSSQKNVKEVSSWLAQNTAGKEGFILISAASHDAIIFSSGLPMKKFIHEGTGQYWEDATADPARWARWIVMRTYSQTDAAYRLVSVTPGFSEKYDVVNSFPFADIYELKPEYFHDLNTKPVHEIH